jgi:hypothetical protein
MRTANAKLRFEAEQNLIRFEDVIKLQMAEITKLRTENKRLLDRILGNTDVPLLAYKASTKTQTRANTARSKQHLAPCHSNDPNCRWQSQFVALMS